MDWSELTAAKPPRTTLRIPYGRERLQFAELWLPDGPGPHPVVFAIHGGCWTSKIANLHIMSYAAEDLRRRGIAVWNVEYRGVDAGGGYPGTFEDVLAAAQALRGSAGVHHLDLSRVVLLGHSAGAHLALWLAGRRNIVSGPLHGAEPLQPLGVISLGGLPDLASAGRSCDPATVARLVGERSEVRPDPLADTSPLALLPLGVPQWLVHGARDEVAPPHVAAGYLKRAQSLGDPARQMVIQGAGHVELIAPGTPAWAEVVRLTETALGR